MNLIAKNITIDKTARYFVLGEPSEKIKSVLFVLHGYSQLAEEFIKYFEPIKNESVLIVAPEALNRFYVNGFSGKVGATWMTKEDGENEIGDYTNYLDSIYNNVINRGVFLKVKITILGFSQGATTACRWVSCGKSKIDQLILWGGGVPHDIDFESLKSVDLTIVVGDKDEFISAEQIEAEEEKLKKNNIKYSLMTFEGKHIIKKEILLKLFI